MATHTGRAFLNSCLKVPIDPCNNCPAPIYNRPKMYLGRFSTTPMRSVTTATNTGKLTTATSLRTAEIETDAMWTSTGVRSLAKFYDSIPDYCEINHLPEEEFYSTLDTLKTTCRELKTKSLNSFVLEESSNTSTLSSSHCGKSKQSKKSSSKKKAGSGKKKKPHQQKQHQWSHVAEESRCVTETPCSLDSKKYTPANTSSKCFKQEFAAEVDALKKTLKDFEAEFKRPNSSTTARPKSCSTSFARDKKAAAQFFADNIKENVEKVPVRPFTACLRESIKKSFSFNDLHSLHESTNSKQAVGCSSRNEPTSEERKKPFDKLTRAEILAFKDRTRLSNYFMQKTSKANENKSDLPRIVVESPSSETLSSKLSSVSTSRQNATRKKKSKSKKREEQIQIPFNVFDLTDSKRDILELHSTPSPVHPVARPNLAATLRAEVSKKKVKELQNNCTYHDTTPQFDWEVRKTPAWKSLSLNETHKEILLLRLATRKAEQALQRREYDLNMELMRQRVKSAPLLLEGTTFWGPEVGKLTHTCRRDGMRHACHSNQQRRLRKKSASSSRADTVGPRAAEEGGGSEAGSRLSHRMNTLRKIYTNSAANYSRNSHSQRNEKQSSRKARRMAADEDDDEEECRGNDSGDELSSVDRAYL